MFTESKLSFLCLLNVLSQNILIDSSVDRMSDYEVCVWLAKKKKKNLWKSYKWSHSNSFVISILFYEKKANNQHLTWLISWPICLSWISFSSRSFKRILQPRAWKHRATHTITFTLFTSTALENKNITSKHSDEALIGWSGYNDALSIFYSRACQAGTSR